MSDSPLQKWRRLGEAGMTLVELTLVICIIGILAYVAWPKTDTIAPSMELATALQKVKSDLRYAQSLATTTTTPHGFRVVGPSTYEIYNAATGTTVTSPLTHNPMHEDLSGSFGQTKFGGNQQPVVFDSWGKPANGMDTTISLTDANLAMSLHVSASSGYIGVN